MLRSASDSLWHFPAFAVAAWLALAAVGRAQEHDGRLHPFLQQHTRLSADDHAALARGGVASTMAEASCPYEIAAFGSVRVGASPAAVAEAALDVERFARSEGVTALGRFSTPPRLSDLDGLTFDAADLEALRDCRVGRCSVKVTAQMLDRLQREVAWQAPDWRAQATVVLRQQLLEHVTRYLATGPAGLAEFVDKPQPVSAASETSQMLRDSPYLQATAPALLEHLDREQPLADVRHVVYWTVERFGYKPTVTATHLAVYAPDAGRAFVVATQIFATHYVEAAVSLTVAAAEPSGPASPATLVMFLQRSRVDALRHGFPWLARRGASSRIRRRLEADLAQRKALVEAAGAVGGAPGRER